jgi:hypothetical protein
MSTIDTIQSEFQVSIIPKVKHKNNDSVPNEPISIQIRDEWTMIVKHPIFEREYKAYIRNVDLACHIFILINSFSVAQLGAHVRVMNDCVTLFPNPLEATLLTPSKPILKNKTNNFIQSFQTQIFRDLDKHQIDTLQKSSKTVAFKSIGHNSHRVAAKSSEMHRLKRKLFPMIHSLTTRGRSPNEILPLPTGT